MKLPRFFGGSPSETRGEPTPPAGAPASTKGFAEADLLAQAEAFNRAADVYWKDVLAEPSARRHVLNKPFGGLADAPGMVYRLGLLLSELRLGLGHTVLDFGAGSGWLSSCLNRLGCRTIAVDVSPAALEMAKELFRIDPRHRPELDPRFLAYDGHRLPLPAASVDRIACFDAFHHVPNQDEVLAELYRVLRPGGRAVLAEPGEGHSHSEVSAYEVDRCGVLENELDVLDLERRARKAGFTDVSLKPYPDPDAIRLSPAEYVALMEGDGRVFPLATLSKSLRNFFLVTLTKGETRVDSRNPGRLRAAIERRGPVPPRAPAGSDLEVPLLVRNEGDTLWLHEEDPIGGYVLLSGHLVDDTGYRVKQGFFRQLLPNAVAPGEAVEVTASLPLPQEAGRYRVQFDMLDEHVSWFAQAGSPSLEIVLDVDAAGGADGLRARIEALDEEPPRAPAGTTVPLRLRITNLGGGAWPHAPEPRPHTVSLAGHLLEADGRMHERDTLHQPLPSTVAPGQSIEMAATVRAPLEPGAYRLKLDLVLEHVCWFEQRGSSPLELPLIVTDEVPDSARPGVLRASLELLEPAAPVRAQCGSRFALRLRATNLGNTRWLSAARATGGHVTLGGHLLDEAREMIAFDHLRSPLPQDVEPGQTLEIRAEAPVPATPGRYLLELDLVDEGIAWFGALGSPTLRLEILAVADESH